MAYLCRICEEVAYDNWRSLWGHIIKSHKDMDRPGKEECYIPDEEVPEGVEIKKKGGQKVIPTRGEEVVATQFEDEDTNKLHNLLLLHGVRQAVADRVSNLFDKLELYREPYNLSNLLKQSLSRQEQIAIVPILMELFPGQREQISGFMPVTPFESSYYRQPGMYGFSSGLPANPAVETRLDKIEKVLEKVTDERNPKEDSNEIKALKLQVEESKTQLEAEKERRLEDERKVTQERINQLISQQQQTPALVKDAIKEVIDRLERDRALGEEAKQKAKQELLEAGYGPKAGQDFESRVLDIVENQAAPAFIGEVREGRKTLTDIAKRFAPIGGASEETPSGPISDEEAARLSEALNIEETMREMAAKGIASQEKAGIEQSE